MWKGWIWRYWLGRLGRTAAFVMFVCLLSVGTTAYIVNGYVQALLGQFGIKLEEPTFSASEVWKSIRDFQIGPKSSNAPSDAETGNRKASDAGAESGASSDGGSRAESVGEAEGEANQGEEVPREDAWRESDGGGGVEDGVRDAWADRSGQAYSLLFSRLTAEQLDRLASLLEDGLTEEEAAELESLLRELFTEEEWKQILQILKPLDDRFRRF